MDHLTATTWDDGGPRLTTTIGISWGEGRFLATLRNRAEQRVTFVSAETITELWDCIHRAVDDPDTVWRKDQFGKKPK